METVRYLLGGCLVSFGVFVVITNYVRQVSNFRRRTNNGHWSSSAPIIGPLFIIVGYAAMPIEFSKWVFLAIALDPDTVITIIGIPELIRALRE